MIAAYQFKADTFCPGCVMKAVTSDSRYDGWALATGVVMSTEDDLNEMAAAFGIDRDDEWSFDSDDFPKVVLVEQVTDDETCGWCGGSIE